MQPVPRNPPDPPGAPDPSTLGWPRLCLRTLPRLLFCLAYFGLVLYLTIEGIFVVIDHFTGPPGPEATLDGKETPFLVLPEPSPPPGDEPPASPLHHPSPP